MRAREGRAVGGCRVGERVGDSAVVAGGGGPLASVRWRRVLLELDGFWGGHCAVRDTWRKRRLVRGGEILYTSPLYSHSQIFAGGILTVRSDRSSGRHIFLGLQLWKSSSRKICFVIRGKKQEAIVSGYCHIVTTLRRTRRMAS